MEPTDAFFPDLGSEASPPEPRVAPAVAPLLLASV